MVINSNQFPNCQGRMSLTLKQHNDIVEKLLKKLNDKESEMEDLRKEMRKTGAKITTNTKIQISENEAKLNKKITQLQKEHKTRLDTLTQQLRNKSTEVKDLKERINIKKNQQQKQKQHIAEVLKKTASISSHDPKFAAMISHYQSQIEKKQKHIASLQKQIKEAYYSKGNKIPKQQAQNTPDNTEEHTSSPPNILKDEHYHTQYQQQITGLKSEINKLKGILDEKTKEVRQWNRRYSQLTKDYYKILNEFGVKEPKKDEPKPLPTPNHKKPSKMKTGIDNILDQMLSGAADEGNQSLSYSFMSSLSKMQGAARPDEDEPKLSRQLQKAESILQSIMQMIGVQLPTQIVPALTKIQAKYEEMIVYENSSRYVQSMMYRMGMGKIPVSELIPQLQKLEQKISKMAEDQGLLGQICIEAGAKKDRLIDKIRDFKATQDQFFSNMKDIKFMQQLPKANKLIQFIEYFQLDKEVCQLPNQLKKMYEQLKYVERFMKQANTLLGRSQEGLGLQKCLDGIIRFLQRKTIEQSLQTTTKNERKSRKNQE